MDWTIPRIHAEPLTIPLQSGDRLFMVGANGSGKSALIQNFVSSNPDEKIKRISAHRQTWLSSGSISMTPKSRRDFDINNKSWEMQYDARWIDYDAEGRLSAILFDLVSKDNARARSITRLVDNKNMNKASIIASNSASPFDQLNELLALGTLAVSLENNKDEEIHARHRNSGATFSMAQLSDGERNAVIIAATVLTVEAGTVLLIDEPERHLHRSIIEPFLSALFKQRDDCIFIISTHEISLPVVNPEARVLMVRSCQWSSGDAPSSWDVKMLEANMSLPEDLLPEDLKRAILGARRRILFVEGNHHSLDVRLYSALFPDISMIPVDSCVAVKRAVTGLRNSQDHHHTEAFGLIDRDDRTEDDVTKLAEDGIFALNVCSVEALYYCSDAIDAVARQQARVRGRDADSMAASARRALLDALRQDDLAKRMSARQCERQIRNEALSLIPGWKAIMDGENFGTFPSTSSHYSAELQHFKKLAAEENLDDLVARYPLRHSNVFDEIAKALLCTSRRDYEQIVIARARGNSGLAGKLRRRIGPLCRALGEA